MQSVGLPEIDAKRAFNHGDVVVDEDDTEVLVITVSRLSAVLSRHQFDLMLKDTCLCPPCPPVDTL